MYDKKESDGMRYPSIDQLTSKSSSKYKLVIAAAKRAREIEVSGESYLEKTHNRKSIGIALEEIVEDKVKVL